MGFLGECAAKRALSGASRCRANRCTACRRRWQAQIRQNVASQPIGASIQHLSAACLLLLAAIAGQAGAASSSASAPRRLARSIDTTHVEIVDAGGRRARLARGERHGDWTLMHVAAGSIARRLIEAHITLPAGIPSPTKLRLRVPGELPVRSVAIDGEDWRAFDATTETVDLPAHPRGALHVRVRY